MIKKMRCKFICIAMACVGAIFLLNLLVINISMNISNQREAAAILERVIHEDGRMIPEHGEQPESPKDNKDPQGRKRIARISGLKRTFAVKLDQDGEILTIIDNGSSSLTEDEIRELAKQIGSGPKTEGMIRNHRYRSAKTPYGTIIAFLDCSREQNNMNRLMIICLTAGAVGIILLFVLVLRFSAWAVKPVEEGFKRQRQFIADAGHELKTPLAVISSNTSVLEGLYGKSQWTGYIGEEVERMGRLINDMLKLAMMERPESKLEKKPFDFSQMATQVLLSYESMAYEQMKEFGYLVDPDITYNGNRDALNQMLHIFVDNAFKYSGAGGKVEITVKKERRGLIIQVYNTGSSIANDAKDQVFERFYREETSHSRETDGYGLGLSIAKEIIDRHHGKVEVKSDETAYVSFIIHL